MVLNANTSPMSGNPMKLQNAWTTNGAAKWPAKKREKRLKRLPTGQSRMWMAPLKRPWQLKVLRYNDLFNSLRGSTDGEKKFLTMYLNFFYKEPFCKLAKEDLNNTVYSFCRVYQSYPMTRKKEKNNANLKSVQLYEKIIRRIHCKYYLLLFVGKLWKRPVFTTS